MNVYLYYLARITLAILLGLFVGYERDQQEKPAGMRDVALVSVGATLFTIIGLEIASLPLSGGLRYDIGRIMSYIVISMGFLGSGVIIQNKNKLEGITTASMLWTIVAVGILCGLGKYMLAVVASLYIYFILKLKYFRIRFETEIKSWDKKLKKRKRV